jgi:hypothetical protein
MTTPVPPRHPTFNVPSALGLFACAVAVGCTIALLFASGYWLAGVVAGSTW